MSWHTQGQELTDESLDPGQDPQVQGEGAERGEGQWGTAWKRSMWGLSHATEPGEGVWRQGGGCPLSLAVGGLCDEVDTLK